MVVMVRLWRQVPEVTATRRQEPVLVGQQPARGGSSGAFLARVCDESGRDNTTGGPVGSGWRSVAPWPEPFVRTCKP